MVRGTMAMRIALGVALATSLVLIANAHAQEITDSSYSNLWGSSQANALAMLRAKLPNPDRARVRELSSAMEQFKPFCFSTFAGGTF